MSTVSSANRAPRHGPHLPRGTASSTRADCHAQRGHQVTDEPHCPHDRRVCRPASQQPEASLRRPACSTCIPAAFSKTQGAHALRHQDWPRLATPGLPILRSQRGAEYRQSPGARGPATASVRRRELVQSPRTRICAWPDQDASPAPVAPERRQPRSPRRRRRQPWQRHVSTTQ